MDKYSKANAILSVFVKRYMDLKNDFPIRPSEMAVLDIITQFDGLYTPALLARLMGVSKPMITAHITSLEEKGYITKKSSDTDKRVYYILPTDKARLLVDAAKTDLDKQLKFLMMNMGENEFDGLIQLAQKANEILERKEKLSNTPEVREISLGR